MVIIIYKKPFIKFIHNRTLSIPELGEIIITSKPKFRNGKIRFNPQHNIKLIFDSISYRPLDEISRKQMVHHNSMVRIAIYTFIISHIELYLHTNNLPYTLDVDVKSITWVK